MVLYLVVCTITSVKLKRFIINSLFARLFCAYCEIAEDEEGVACAQVPGTAGSTQHCPNREL